MAQSGKKLAQWAHYKGHHPDDWDDIPLWESAKNNPCTLSKEEWEEVERDLVPCEEEIEYLDKVIRRMHNDKMAERMNSNQAKVGVK